MPTRSELLQTLDKWDCYLDRLNGRVDDTADFSRVERKEMALRLAPCSLADVVSSALREFAAPLQESQVATTVRLDHAAVGCWDEARLGQVCTNLLTNAVKYGGGHPVCIEVVDGPDQATLRVSDQGSGIAAADKKRIFRPYERANDGQRATSLGLGLYICQQIVRAHGGIISLDSARGRGSTFCVELPKRVSSQAASMPKLGAVVRVDDAVTTQDAAAAP